MAYRFGAELEDLADPTDTTYNPRPEWYFLFLFQALKFFPGNLESVAAIVVPGAAVTFLVLLPFLDRGPERHPLKRPLLTGLGVIGLVAIGYLTWTGYKSPLTNPIVEKDPMVLAGQRLYQNLNCAYCHKIGGKGGAVGPELDKVAGEETQEWLKKHFSDPQMVNSGSAMPKLGLLDEEIKVLSAYLKSFSPGSYTQEAPELFTQNCAICHQFKGKGGTVGPDLSLIGSARDKEYIRKYIEDPAGVNPASSMPGFRGQLADTQIEDLARYLTAQGSEDKKESLIFTGQKLYDALKCAYCHKIAGDGGDVGPELDKVARVRTAEWLERHFRDPQTLIPGSSMPKFDFPRRQIQALTAYLKSLEGGAPSMDKVARLFVENCAVCHKLRDKGGNIGPDLSLIGTMRDRSFIKRYIEDPASLNPISIMPGFKGKLTQIQIEDLASSLAFQETLSKNKQSLILATGQRLYRDLRCAYCHKIRGKGGDMGPELDKVGSKRTKEWLKQHFGNPSGMTPGSSMPKFHLPDNEAEALAVYLQSLYY